MTPRERAEDLWTELVTTDCPDNYGTEAFECDACFKKILERAFSTATSTDIPTVGGHDYEPCATWQVCRRCGMRADPVQPKACADRLVEQLTFAVRERDTERQRADAADRAVEKYKKETATAWTRIAELEAALRRAEPFTHPGISRGPGRDEWVFMRRDVEAALAVAASPEKRPPAISEEAHRARLPPHPAVLLNPKDPASPAMATKDEQCDGCGHEPHSFDCNKVLPGDLGNVCGCEHVTARVYLDSHSKVTVCRLCTALQSEHNEDDTCYRGGPRHDWVNGG